MTNHILHEVLTRARTAASHRVHERGPGMEPIYTPKRAAVLRAMALKSTMLPNVRGSSAGETTSLAAAIIEQSRVAQAGAHILVQEDKVRAVPTGQTGIVATQREAAKFSTIAPATFATIADDEEVAVTTSLPVSRADIDWSAATTVSVRYEIGHVAQKASDEAQQVDELLVALTLGLARQADRLLLDAIVATTPAAFTLGAAAAQGLKARELRAIVGTDGTGAYFGADGALVVNVFDTNGPKPSGIPGELSGDTAATIVGGWDRAGVAVSSDMHILAERTAKNGTLALTAWASMLTLLPDTSKFWTVTA